MSGRRHRDRQPSGGQCLLDCRQLLVLLCCQMGITVNVSHVPPLFDRGYERLDMRCPHGLLWYVEPTNSQIAAWQAAGVR